MFCLEYKNGNMLKDMNKKDYYVHSCNCIGVWGGGIALQLAHLFPKSYGQHKKLKKDLGTSHILTADEHKIACIMTSLGFGSRVAKNDSIAEQTEICIRDLLEQIEEEEITIHSPKINAGLFKTPWEKTVESIKKACESSNKKIKWVVWII